MAVKWLPGVACVEIGALVRTIIFVPAGTVAARLYVALAALRESKTMETSFRFIGSSFRSYLIRVVVDRALIIRARWPREHWTLGLCEIAGRAGYFSKRVHCKRIALRRIKYASRC